MRTLKLSRTDKHGRGRWEWVQMGRSFGQRTLPGEQKERRTGGNTARWRDGVAPCSLREEHEEATRQEPDPKESHRPRRRSDSHLHRKHTESL